MKTKKEIRDWLLGNAVDEDGDLMLDNLDFSDFDGNVYIESMKVKCDLIQSRNEVQGNLFQSDHTVQGYLYQSNHTVQGHLYQTNHGVKGDLTQSRHKVQGHLYQRGHEVKGSVFQYGHKVQGHLYQYGHEVQGDLYQLTEIKETMSLNDYQVKSKRTLNQGLTKEQTVSNMIMGILGETGEVADIIKKHYYQGHDLDIEHIKEEIGDVMFYIVNLCNVLDLDLEALLYQNHAKLMKRYPNGFNEKNSIERDTQGEN